MDLLRLVPQILAAAFIVAFFVLAALVIFGTAIACLRTRPPARRRSAGTRATRTAPQPISPERPTLARS